MVKLFFSIATTLSIFAASAVGVSATLRSEGSEPVYKKRAVVEYLSTIDNAVPKFPGQITSLNNLLLTYICEETKVGTLRLVCKGWKRSLDAGTKLGVLSYLNMGSTWQKGMQIWYGFLGEETMLRTYLGGSLVYRSGTSEEKVFPISELKNPFAATFDLNGLDDFALSGLEKWKDLSINTGLRPGKNEAKKGEYEVWIIPWVLAHKMGQAEGAYLQPIMKDWNPKVCSFAILFSVSGFDNSSYVYCTCLDSAAMSTMDLHHIYNNKISEVVSGSTPGDIISRIRTRSFMVGYGGSLIQNFSFKFTK